MLQNIHPDDQERLRAAWLARGGECDEEFRLVRPDGTVRWVRGRVFAVESQQSPEPRRAGIVGDVTAQKEALTALIHAERLTTAGRLAASLAHEINNPLQSAIGCLDLAREALEEGSDPLPFMQVIADALLRAARVVAQLRSLHRRTQPETRQAVDLGQILDEVLLLTRKKCYSQKVEVTCDVASDLPEMSVMPDAMQQVFLNLVLNAADAMPHGGELRIEIRASSQPEGVYIRFADTGVGVAPEMRDRLFEPFQTTKTEGLGLGLFISHSIVQQHGGRIELESEAGNGTVFSLWLPA